MTGVAVLSPLLQLQEQTRRVHALEIQRFHHHHDCASQSTTIEEESQQVVVVNEQMRRARTGVEQAGLYSSVWTWVPPNYYSWSLQARADYLQVPNANVNYLCKSLLLENKKVLEDDGDNMDHTNPKYILVVLQYAATLDVKKLITAIRAMRSNIHERLDEKHDFDIRVATPQDNAVLTGYEHNSVTPFGLLQSNRILIVLSQEIVALRRFWMGGGHENLKLSMAVSDFTKALNPLIADISNPRTGLDLATFVDAADLDVSVPHHNTDSCSGVGGAAAPAAPESSANRSAAAAAAAAAAAEGSTSDAANNNNSAVKEKKHKKRHSKDKDKKKKHRSSKKDSSSPKSSSCSASQTSEESKEKKVGEGYIVHVQLDDTDDHSVLTTPVIRKKKSSKDKDKDKDKKKKKRSSKTILEDGTGVIVEESTTTSSSNKSHDHSSEPSHAAESPKSNSSSKSPPVAAASLSSLPMVPQINNIDEGEEDSPGKTHRFHVLLDAEAPFLPAVPQKEQKPKDSKKSVGRAMSSDLQAIMKRRREMADGKLSSSSSCDAVLPTAALLDTTSKTKKKNHDGRRLKKVEMSSDLQAIMARRRKLAGGDDDVNDKDSD